MFGALKIVDVAPSKGVEDEPMMIPGAAMTDLQRRYRLAMASGSVEEMSSLFEQIQRLRLAQIRRKSTQRMLAVVLEAK